MLASIGIESSVLVRENRKAVRRALLISSALASTMPSTFFWLGQMTIHTLKSMISEPGADAERQPVHGIPSARNQAEGKHVDGVLLVKQEGESGQPCDQGAPAEPPERAGRDVAGNGGATGPAVVGGGVGKRLHLHEIEVTKVLSR